MSIAVCDQDAFYPLRNLVTGPFTDYHELAEVERFVRTVVLHDEITMELEPLPHDPYSEEEIPEEEWHDGKRTVIVAYGPVLSDYDFFTSRLSGGKPATPEITLATLLKAKAQEFANAGEGNAYYRAHIEYLRVHTRFLTTDSVLNQASYRFFPINLLVEFYNLYRRCCCTLHTELEDIIAICFVHTKPLNV